MVLCDLPYGTTHCRWDNIIPFEPMWQQYKRVCKTGAVICLFSTEPFGSKLRMSNIKDFKFDYVWDKHRTTGFLNAKKKPLARHENILVFSSAKFGHFTYNPIMRNGKMRKKGGYNKKPVECYSPYKERTKVNDLYYPTSIISIGTVCRNKSVHPTEKPVALLEYIINQHSNPGETVLDNCMGSGSTGVAAVNTGRNFIGIEIDEKYFGIAEKRIGNAILDREKAQVSMKVIRREV